MKILKLKENAMTDVVVIGAGASGLLAAGKLASFGTRVVLLEKNKTPGKKLAITGKGRCNITNNCDVCDVIKNVPTNGNFLYSALSKFSPFDVMEFFERLGVKLKVERGNRVFPVSDKAYDVISALVKFCKDSGVFILNQTAVDIVYNNGRVKSVKTNNQIIECKYVIVATGGLSYPQTGSTGDGYLWAKKAGHKITPLFPSLVPIVTAESWPTMAQGIPLKNVKLSVFDGKKCIFSSQGEMLFTHFGVSGPLVLSASAHMGPIKSGRYKMFIDLKPALDKTKLENRILREISSAKNKSIKSVLRKLLPQKLIMPCCTLLNLNYNLKANQFTKEQRLKLVDLLKCLPMTVKAFRPIKDAIITSGGVDVSEINPKTMQSRLQEGLYFIGEILDLDGYTGGFNLQIAWSTAATAADDILHRL